MNERNDFIHILGNAYGHSESAVREARHWAHGEIERLMRDLALLRPVCSAISGGLVDGEMCPTCKGRGIVKPGITTRAAVQIEQLQKVVDAASKPRHEYCIDSWLDNLDRAVANLDSSDG